MMHSLPSPSALQMIGVSKKMVDAKNFFSSFQLLFLDDGEYRRRRILTWVCVYSSYIRPPRAPWGPLDSALNPDPDPDPETFLPFFFKRM